MIFLESIRIALGQIWVNKLRTALTLLGMMIGVGAVVGIVSIGEGMRQFVIDEFGKLGGSQFVMISPQYMHLRDGRWVPNPRSKPLTMDDLRVVEQSSDRLAAVLPSMNSGANLRYRKASYQSRAAGTLPALSEVYNWQVAEGRFLLNADLDKLRRVCVIGQEVREELFGLAPFLGRELKLNGQRFTVVGLMEDRQTFGEDWGDQVLVPVTTAQRRLAGNKYIQAMVAHAKEQEDVPDITVAIEEALKKRHGPEASYQIISGRSILEQVEQTILLLKLVVGGNCGDFAVGRRHWHYEHLAGVGGRAHPRDWHPQGPRCQAGDAAVAICDRGDGPELDGGSARGGCGLWVGRGHCARHFPLQRIGLSQHCFARGHAVRAGPVYRDWPFLWHLSGSPRVAARSGGCVALGVISC